MFISRRVFDELTELGAKFAAAITRVAALEAENARLKASCDWLAQHVSELSAERAALFNRVLEIQLPVLSIARESTAPDPRSVPDRGIPLELTPEALRGMAARFAPPPTTEAGQVYRPTTAETEASAAMDLFNDVGNERAAALGIKEGPDGEVIYER